MSKLVIMIRLKNTFATSSGEYCESGPTGMHCSGGRGRRRGDVVAGAPLPSLRSLNGVA